jgi:hypothetical protein
VQNSTTLVAQASEVAEKPKFLSFRGTLRAEESLILLTLEPREIPHFVRNDKNLSFSAACSACGFDRGMEPSCFGVLKQVRHTRKMRKVCVSAYQGGASAK